MAGLVPAIHALLKCSQDVDARHKAGHDEFNSNARFCWLHLNPTIRMSSAHASW